MLLAGIVAAVLYALFVAGLIISFVLLSIEVVLVILLHRLISGWYARVVKLPPVVPDYRLQE